MSRLHGSRLVTLIAALSITIVRLPVYFGAKSILDPLILLVLVSCVGWGISRQPRGSFTNKPALLAFLYATLIVVALFRGAQAGAVGTSESAASQGATYLLFVALGIVLITSARDRQERNGRLLAIALSPVVYVFVNLVMYSAGLQSSSATGGAAGAPAELLQFLGITSGRAKFPLATSINLFSIIVAAALASVVVLRLRAPSLVSRRITWLAIISCTYCLLLGDSRGSLIIAVIVILIFAVRIRIPAAVAAGIVPLLPLLVLGVLALIAGSQINSELSRGSGQFHEIATGTGRLYIWQGSWETLRHISFQDLYGWGAGGHITSGASLHYAFVFPNNPEATKIFTHDIVLQMIFDTGYLGLALLVIAVWTTWQLLERYSVLDQKSPAAALMAIIAVILLSGATEVSPSYYSQEALLAVLLIMGAAAGLGSSRKLLAAHPPADAPKQTTVAQGVPRLT